MMAPPKFRLAAQIDSDSFDKVAGSSGAQSRSTSAGSVPSDSQGSVNLQIQKSLERSPPRTSFGQDYAMSTPGLPEYDYPAPFSIGSCRDLPVCDFPTPLIVKNTFFDTASCLRPSTLEFYADRQTKSCPASGISLSSGISLPPGLEDLFEPEETAAKLVAAETTLAPFLPPPPQQQPAFDIDWQSSLSPAPSHEAPTVFDTKWPSPLSVAAPPCAPPTFDASWQSPVSPAPLHDPVLGGYWHSPVPLAPTLAPQQPMVLDLMQALSSVKEEQVVSQQPPFFCDQLATPGFSLPPMRTANIVPTSDTALGSLECPTVGSQGHWTGSCKPCAFFYTRGCGNGVQCPFCHLCDEGEKKRRAKDKRASLRGSKQGGY